MFTLKVGTASQYLDIDANETRLVVPFEIVDETEAVMYDHKQSFPLTATEEEIREALQRALTVFTDDHARYEAGKVAQASLEASVAVAAAISNTTITPEV